METLGNARNMENVEPTYTETTRLTEEKLSVIHQAIHECESGEENCQASPGSCEEKNNADIHAMQRV